MVQAARALAATEAAGHCAVVKYCDWLVGKGHRLPRGRRVEHEVTVVAVWQRRQVARLERDHLGSAPVEKHRVAHRLCDVVDWIAVATVELGPRLQPADDHAAAEQCCGTELLCRGERLKLLEEQLDRGRHAAAILRAVFALIREGRQACHLADEAQCHHIRPRAGLQQQADGRQRGLEARAEDRGRTCYTTNVRAGAGFEECREDGVVELVSNGHLASDERDHHSATNRCLAHAIPDARVRVVVEQQLHDLQLEVWVLAQPHWQDGHLQQRVAAFIGTRIERYATLDEQLSELEVAELLGIPCGAARCVEE
eukprot:scaffold11663_cov73-Phaeocystis_antarctica.AAC.4